MTKARTLASFDATGVLTSTSTLNPANLDDTGTIPSALLAGVGGGITEADQWRITTTFQGAAVPISTDWERNDDTFGVHGTGMTESSGVFTFPSTGVYLVTYQFTHQFDVADGLVNFDIEGCTDGSSFNRISRTQMGGSGGDYRSGFCNALFTVNNASNHKVRFTLSSANNSNSTTGATGDQQTGATFIRLSDI